MNKTELIFTHQLLVETRDFLAREDGDVATPNHDEKHVEGIAIHKSKTDHKNALLALGEDLSNHCEAPEAETISA